jgi:hypothetical protein
LGLFQIKMTTYLGMIMMPDLRSISGNLEVRRCRRAFCLIAFAGRPDPAVSSCADAMWQAGMPSLNAGAHNQPVPSIVGNQALTNLNIMLLTIVNGSIQARSLVPALCHSVPCPMPGLALPVCSVL